MKLIRKCLFLFAIVAVANSAAASGNLNAVLNAFIAKFAKTSIAWKKEIVLTRTPNEIPPGTQLGLSIVAGYYYFTPKEWDDLSEDEQHELLADPRLPSFIIGLRNASQPPTDGESRTLFGENGRPLFPVEGLTVGKVAQEGSAVGEGRTARVAKIKLTGEDVVGTAPIRLEVLR